MASIADLFFKAQLEDDKLQLDAKKAGDKAGQTLGQRMSGGIKKNISDIGTGIKLGAGIAAFGLLETAIGGVGGAISGTIDDASNLNETITKSDVIFGKNAAAVKTWGDTASREFGQSKRAALDTASTFAGLFSTVGLTLDDATDKAKTLTKLGSDLASFFNTDVATATQALRSGLAGESEPLRQFNVFLSETAVAAKATQLGLKKVNGQFTEGQKVTARYAIIMDQTGAAQGDFARTSDGLANKQRILQARIEDVSAQIGNVLLPIMLKLADFVLTSVVPALELIGPALTEIIDVTQKASDVLNGLVGVDKEAADSSDLLGSKTTLLGQALHWLAAQPGAVTDAITGTSDASRAAAATFNYMATRVKDDAARITASAQAMASAVKDDLARIQPEIQKSLGGWAGTAWTKTLVANARAAGNRMAGGLASGIREKRDAVDQAWQDLLENLKHQLTPTVERARLLGRLASMALQKGLKSGDPAVKAEAQALKQAIIDRLQELGTTPGNIGKKGMEALRRGMKSKDPDVRAAATAIYNSAKNPISKLPAAGHTYGANFTKQFASGLRSRIDLVAAAAGAISKALSNNLRAQSPTKEGPLSTLGGPEGWGARIAQLFTKGLYANLPDLAGALGSGLRVPSMTLGHAVPSMAFAGSGTAAVRSIGAVPPGGDTYNITVPVQGLIPYTDPLVIQRSLQRLGRTGGLTPK